MKIFYYTMIFSVISLCTSSLILYIFIRYKRVRNFDAAKYALVLQLFDFSLALTTIIPLQVFSDDLCIIQGFFEQIFSESLLLWTFVVSLALHYEITLEKGKNSFPFKSYLIGICAVSIILAILPLPLNLYSKAGGWCAIEVNETDGFIALLCFFYIPLWLINLWNIYAYTRLLRRLKRDIGRSKNGMQLIRTLVLWPLVLFITYTPMSVVRMMEGLHDEADENFYIVASCFARSHGILNSISYGINPEVKKLFKSKNVGSGILLENARSESRS